MEKQRFIKRYNAYYQGWCLAFGEHVESYAEGRDVNWLVGEGRIGMIVAPKLRRVLHHTLLSHHEKIPELVLEDDKIMAQGITVYQLVDQIDRDGMRTLKQFLDCEDELYLFLTNHFIYPAGTRILTFASEKPTILLYKEMQPLKVLIR